MRPLLLLLAVCLVNLPAVHQAWTGHRIDADGRDVAAVVLDTRTIDGRHLVDYRLPEDADPAGNEFSARVDDETYRRARETDRLVVRVVPGEPGANRPYGEVTSPVLVAAAVGADAILLLIGGVWLLRRRARSQEPDGPPQDSRA